MPRLIGAHMPTSKGLPQAVRDAKAIGCTALQVFTSSPRMWRGKTVTDDLAKEFKAAMKETGIDFVASHDTYLVNLCCPNPDMREKSAVTLAGELERCSKLGIKYVVSHMGAHMGEGEAKGLKEVAKVIRKILKETPDDVCLAMETTAGQGSALFYKFEHLAQIIEDLKGDERLGVCLDTCHIFAAGYDIRAEDVYEETMKEFDRIIGFDRLKLIHANDSLKPFGSRRDRHAHIAEGEIGEWAFRRIANDKRIEHAPLIVETPEAEKMHAENVRRLQSYRG